MRLGVMISNGTEASRRTDDLLMAMRVRVRRETIRTAQWVQSKAASVAEESVVPAARTGKAVLISPPEDMRVMRPRARVWWWRVVSCGE